MIHEVGASVKKQNPSALQQYALSALLDQFAALCSHSNYEENKRGLKHFLKFQLPPFIRQQLLYIALDDGRIYTLVDLNLYELLLSPVVQDLRVKTIRPFYRESFSRILQQLGTGLQILGIEDSSWTQPRHELNVALTQLRHLRQVSLRYLASDAMLNTLAKSCRHLQELDVTGSQDVTNEGMQRLCLPSSEQEPCPCALETTTPPSRKISVPANFGFPALKSDQVPSGRHTAGCVVWIPKLIKGIRRYSVVNPAKIEVNGSSSACAHLLELPTVTEVLGVAPCAKTLRILSVSGTRVTNEGISIVKQYMPKISIIHP